MDEAITEKGRPVVTWHVLPRPLSKQACCPSCGTCREHFTTPQVRPSAQSCSLMWGNSEWRDYFSPRVPVQSAEVVFGSKSQLDFSTVHFSFFASLPQVLLLRVLSHKPPAL